MKRSTGGLVLRERTSVNDGSLFLRLFAQSSCRFSSSIEEVVGIRTARRRRQGCSSLLTKRVVDTNQVVTAYVISIFPRSVVILVHIGTMSFTKALSPALREIRILCSQTGPASAGTRSANECITIGHLLKSSVHRQFIISKYPVIKKHNPDLPVLIREAQGTPARVFARFGACQQSRNFHSILTGRIRTRRRETH